METFATHLMEFFITKVQEWAEDMGSSHKNTTRFQNAANL
jgi:hypothetical protein